MVDGGGRNREIQRLQAAAAANGGEGTARQAQRLEYLQNNRQAGRSGGPLQQAMGQANAALDRAKPFEGRSNEIQRLQGLDATGKADPRQQQRLEFLRSNSDAGRSGMPGQGLREQQPYGNYKDAIRTQQPFQGGASNGGNTWDGQAAVNYMQPGTDVRGSMDAYRNQTQQPGSGMSLSDYQQMQAGRQQSGQYLQDPNSQNGYRPGGGVNPMPRPTPGNMPGGVAYGPEPINPDGTWKNVVNPMPRPTPGNMPGGAPVSMDPGFYNPNAMQRPTPQGGYPGSDPQSRFGYRPPPTDPRGTALRQPMNRPGYLSQEAAPLRNPDPMRRIQPNAGVLAPPPMRRPIGR